MLRSLGFCFYPREAAMQTAEAEKVKVIKAAEAEAEAKFLGGQVCRELWRMLSNDVASRTHSLTTRIYWVVNFPPHNRGPVERHDQQCKSFTRVRPWEV